MLDFLDFLAGRDWMLKALCSFDPYPDDWFSVGRSASAKRAIKVCSECPVRLECLNYANECESVNDVNAAFGIYGGLTPYARRQLRLENPPAPVKATARISVRTTAIISDEPREFPVTVSHVPEKANFSAVPRRPRNRVCKPSVDRSHKKILNLDDEYDWQEFRWRLYFGWHPTPRQPNVNV